jgi:hypothetical protein
VVRFEIFQRVWSLEPEVPGDPEKKLVKKRCVRQLWVAEYSEFFSSFPLWTIDRHFFEFFKKEFAHQLRCMSFTTTNHSLLSYIDWIFAVSFCTVRGKRMRLLRKYCFSLGLPTPTRYYKKAKISQEPNYSKLLIQTAKIGKLSE